MNKCHYLMLTLKVKELGTLRNSRMVTGLRSAKCIDYFGKGGTFSFFFLFFLILA